MGSRTSNTGRKWNGKNKLGLRIHVDLHLKMYYEGMKGLLNRIKL